MSKIETEDNTSEEDEKDETDSENKDEEVSNETIEDTDVPFSADEDLVSESSKNVVLPVVLGIIALAGAAFAGIYIFRIRKR